jgi:hypothetical protein
MNRLQDFIDKQRGLILDFADFTTERKHQESWDILASNLTNGGIIKPDWLIVSEQKDGLRLTDGEELTYTTFISYN